MWSPEGVKSLSLIRGGQGKAEKAWSLKCIDSGFKGGWTTYESIHIVSMDAYISTI